VDQHLIDFDINDSYLRVVNTQKQSLLCEILGVFNVINLRGIFEGINDVFIQSKPMRT
jgi:hypothetical protein